MIILKKSIVSRQNKDLLTGLAFLLPNFLGFLLFTLIPVGASLILSFFSWDLINPPEFVGLENFIDLFTKDTLFWKVMGNTSLYTLMVIPGTLIVSLLLALLVNQQIWGKLVFRFIYFLPVVTSTIAVSLVWNWMYNKDFGLINSFLSLFHIPPVNWLTDTKTALPSIALVGIWSGAGYNMVLFLAGLQGIPKQLYEACELDGANWVQKFFHVTMPMLTPTTFFVLVMSIIGSFQVFDLVFMMTRGGPDNATRTIVSYIYDNAFSFFKLGYASSMAWVLFVIIFILTYIQFKIQNNWVQYYE